MGQFSYFITLRIVTIYLHNYVLGVRFGLGQSLTIEQPRKPGSLPTPGAATKTLVQVDHVTPQNLGYF